jgi:hypothetical protein
MFVSVTRGIFVLCHHIIVNLFVRKPELNGANLPNFDLNSCHFCPSFFCPPTVHDLHKCDFCNVTKLKVLLQMHSSLDEHLYEINYYQLSNLNASISITPCIFY